MLSNTFSFPKLGQFWPHFQVRTCCWNVSGRVFFTPTLIRWSVPQGPWAARHFPGKFHRIGGKKRKPGTVPSADCSHYGSSHRRELPRFPANGWFNRTFIQSFALCVLACFFESYRFYGKWNDIPFFYTSRTITQLNLNLKPMCLSHRDISSECWVTDFPWKTKQNRTSGSFLAV